jgi:hypothetical protein
VHWNHLRFSVYRQNEIISVSAKKDNLANCICIKRIYKLQSRNKLLKPQDRIRVARPRTEPRTYGIQNAGAAYMTEALSKKLRILRALTAG